MITAIPDKGGIIRGLIWMIIVLDPELLGERLERIDIGLDGIVFTMLIRLAIQMLGIPGINKVRIVLFEIGRASCRERV